MPIYEYISEESDDVSRSCPACRQGFEIRRQLNRSSLEKCPLCKNAVKRLISCVSSPKVAKPLCVADAKSKGFTILEKRDEGVYEKL